jgi:hypothetical protein
VPGLRGELVSFTQVQDGPTMGTLTGVAGMNLYAYLT